MSKHRVSVALLCVLLAGCSSGGTTPPSPELPSAPVSPGAVRTPAVVAADQQFTFDDIAGFPDGVEFEMAGTVASKAEPTVVGAGSTKGQMVTVSIRIGNSSELPYDAANVTVTATDAAGRPAPLVLDTVGELQRGFTGSVAPGDETVAPFGFAIAFTQLQKVTFVVDPGDESHETVSFTGKVEQQ